MKSHIDAIFDGLSYECDTFIVLVNSCIDPYSVDEIESLLLAQETQIEKNNKAPDSTNPSANLAMGAMQDAPQRRKNYNNLGNNQNYGK